MELSVGSISKWVDRSIVDVPPFQPGGCTGCRSNEPHPGELRGDSTLVRSVPALPKQPSPANEQSAKSVTNGRNLQTSTARAVLFWELRFFRQPYVASQSTTTDSATVHANFFISVLFCRRGQRLTSLVRRYQQHVTHIMEDR